MGYGVKFLVEAWAILAEFAPWLFLGLGVAGLLHVCLPASFIRRHLGGRGFGSILKAVGLGVPLPLCSCGVIPAALGLKKDGASNGAVAGFLIATPQTGVDSAFVAGAMLGWPFAVFRVAAAVVTGLVGGGLVALAEKSGGAPAAENAPRDEHRAASAREFFTFVFDRLLRGMYRWLLIGIAAAALISAFVPEGAFTHYGTGLTGMFLVLVIAIPLYVCATGSIPLAAVLVMKGMSPGAAIVFLMAGPATNVSTLIAVYKMLGRRALAIYLGTIAVFSMGFGLLFDGLLAGHGGHAAHVHGAGPGAVSVVAAGVLAILMAWFAATDIAAAIRRRLQGRKPREGGMELEVSGMTCENCAAHVRRALEAIPGVRGVTVDPGRGRASFEAEPGFNPEAAAAAVRAAGYGARY